MATAPLPRSCVLLCCAALLAVWSLAAAPEVQARGFSVQLDTRGLDNKFSGLRQQVRDMGLPEYVIAEYSDGVHFYVHAGAFESVEALLAAQDMLRQSLKLDTTLVYDHSTAPVPAATLATLRDAQAKANAAMVAPVAAKAAAAPSGDLHSVQISSSATLDQARALQTAWRAKGFDATVIMLYDGHHVPWHVVQVGACASLAEASALAAHAAREGARPLIHRLPAPLIQERTEAR